MRVRDIAINTYDKGSGEVVLFLHGWGSEFAVFAPFLETLSSHYRVLALDMPGFGKSDPPPRSWGRDEYADFVLEYLRDLGIDRAILLGHSFGGGVCIKLASRDTMPLTIPKMVLIDSAGIRSRRTLKARIKQRLFRTVRSILSLTLMRKAFPDLLEKWRRANASADYINATPLMRSVLVKVVNEDLTENLSRIQCPTLLLWGVDDTATPVAAAKIMEQMIPGAGLVVLPNAGHYPFLDQSYTFGRVLDSFLSIER